MLRDALQGTRPAREPARALPTDVGDRERPRDIVTRVWCGEVGGYRLEALRVRPLQREDRGEKKA